MKLPLIPQDKANHFVYGSLIFLVFAFLLSPLVALALVAFAAIGKEVFDWFSGYPHTPDLNDAIYTIFGGVVCFVSGYSF